MPGAEGDREPEAPLSDVPLLETISQNLPIVLYAIDEDGTFTRSEGRGLAALDLEPNEVVGESVFDVYADHPAVLEQAERALGGEDVNGVVEIDGTVFEVWYRPVTRDGTTEVLGVAVDVTERVRHERLLEEVNEATRELVVAGSEAEIADRIVEINRRVLDEPASVVWFYDRDDDVLRPIAGTNPTAADAGPARAFRELDPIRPGTAEMAAFRERETAFFEEYDEVENAAHPGTRLGTILAVPIGGHGMLTVGATTAEEIGASTPALAEIIARDAAASLERVKRESAVERLHAATRELIEADSAEEIAERTVAAAEGILGHSQTVLRLLSDDGRTLEPVAMTDWIRDVIPDRPAFAVGEGPIGRAFEAGEPVRYDREELEGAMAHDSTAALLALPVGEYGVLSIGEPDPSAFDESTIQLAQVLAANAGAALDRLERGEELRRQNERLEEFAGILSHDLRNPLNIISGNLALARTDPDRIDEVEAAVSRMEAIIDDVLELAREGGTVTDREPVSLADAVARAWGSVQTGPAELMVAEDVDIVADLDRLCRLLENLFRNAVEHGGEDVSLEVGPTEGGFYVEDDGPGIPPEERRTVFEMGYSTGEGGTGLGLAIADEIATAHGWSISVGESEAGGARFEITGVERV